MLERLAALKRDVPRAAWDDAARQVLAKAWPAVAGHDLGTLEPKEVRLVLFCMAKLGVKDEVVIRKLVARGQDVMKRMSCFYVANSMWALGNLGV